MKNAVALIIAVGVFAVAGCSATHDAAKPGAKLGSTIGNELINPPVLLDHLVGKWVLNGQIDGKQTTHDIDAEWVLNREYLRLHEVSRERNAKGGPAYEAIVLFSWDQRAGQYSCLWLDTTGGGGLSGNGIGRGKPDADSIPFAFKFPDGNVFHNTFIFDQKAGSWQWVMDGEEGGKLQPFARVTLTKKIG